MQRESPPEIWMPEAYRFSHILDSNGVAYAIFGAGALAVHKVLVRPTIDIDFVVRDYEKAINLLNDQPSLVSKNLQREKDRIQVADFRFETGVAVQIWDNNLYSLPMTQEAWLRVVVAAVPGLGLVRSICMEDLIVAKVGRYTQQRSENEYEANKNSRDIIATIHVLQKPDYTYILQRLKDGARRETSSANSPIHPLPWYLVREIETYREIAKDFDFRKISRFLSTILARLKSPSVEHYLLHTLRKQKSVSHFKDFFMLDDKATSILLKRWRSFVSVDGDKVAVNSRDIQRYVDSLGSEISEYAKYLAAGKQS